MNRNKIPRPVAAERIDEEYEPRIVAYESGASVLVHDEPGDRVTIGTEDKYFRDPMLSGSMLCFEAIRDDGVKVESYVTPDRVVTARHYDDGVAYDVVYTQ